MKIKLFLFILLLSSILMTSCRSKIEAPAGVVAEASRLVLRQENLAIYQLHCPEFDRLPFKLQRYAYHLSRAALAGRDLIYDQLTPRGLEIRQLIDRLLDEPTADTLFRQRLERYAIKYYVNSGNYDHETSRKFVPEFSAEDLQRAVASDQQLDYLAGLKAYIFDEQFLPVLVNKNPDKGDAVTASAVNFYDRGLTREDVEAYSLEYPLNGRFAKAGSGVVEEVYRAGTPDIAPGRMAGTLARVVEELETALTFAPEGSRGALQALIEYFRTGSKEAFDRHCRLWVEDNSSPVDYIIGFIEVYDDPLAMRGTFEAAIFLKDSAQSAGMEALAKNAAWFEERMPWEERFKKREFTLPSAKAVKMLFATGGQGPIAPSGINLPNDQRLRETVGTKNYMLTNVMNSGSRERSSKLFDEFIATAEERTLALTGFDSRRAAMVGLHEVVGHGSGKADPSIEGDPLDSLKEFASTLEEARADLVAWWYVGDPKLVELGVHSREVTFRGSMISMLAWSLISLRDVPVGDQFEEDHARAEHLICNWVIAKGGARLEKIDGKTYARLIDEAKAKEAVGELLAEIQRIKATGDYAAGKNLVESYGIKFDPALRDEVVGRVKPLDLPDRMAFVMPEVKTVRNKMGGTEAYQVEYPGDFLEQMRRFAKE